RENPRGVASDTTSSFYAKAAQDYLPWAPPEGPVVAMSPTSAAPTLLADRPITQELEVRFGGAQTREKADLRALADPAWLRITPASVEVPPPGPDGKPNRSSFRIELRPGGAGRTSLPWGFLAEARLAGRSFHQRVPLPLAPAGPDILISTNDKAP